MSSSSRRLVINIGMLISNRTPEDLVPSCQRQNRLKTNPGKLYAQMLDFVASMSYSGPEYSSTLVVYKAGSSEEYLPSEQKGVTRLLGYD